MDAGTQREVPPEDRGRHVAPTPAPAADGWDDWREAQGAASAHPGSVVARAGLLVLLVAGLGLMGGAFTDGNGAVFAAGIVVAGLAFAIPLELVGRRER